MEAIVSENKLNARADDDPLKIIKIGVDQSVDTDPDACNGNDLDASFTAELKSAFDYLLDRPIPPRFLMALYGNPGNGEMTRAPRASCDSECPDTDNPTA
jgi:hypothetical protein